MSGAKIKFEDLFDPPEIDAFLRMWEDVTAEDGMTAPLPKNWRIKVVVLSESCSEDDWRYALDEAVGATERNWNPIRRNSLFDYAVGVLWNRIAVRMEGVDPRKSDPYYVSDEARMQAEADRLAAEVAEEERRTQEIKKWEEAERRVEEAWEWLIEDLRSIPRSRTLTGTFHRTDGSGCRYAKRSAATEEYPASTGELCRRCFRDLLDEHRRWVYGHGVGGQR